jgi:acyl-CoA synthetase (NDP forming)/GNAT superfamily N-acetyltransferase
MTGATPESPQPGPGEDVVPPTAAAQADEAGQHAAPGEQAEEAGHQAVPGKQAAAAGQPVQAGATEGPRQLEPDPAESYPAAWEADVVASDGGVVHLRPIQATDADAILAFHAKLSDRTRYLRYFGPYPRIPKRDLFRFTHVDHRNRVALVAVLDEDIIGVGRYDRLSSTGTAGAAGAADAEVAFVVADAHQGRGIGSILLEHLAAAARERGIKRFVAEVLAENSRMVRVFTDAGYSAKYEYDSGVVHLTFPIAPTEQSRAVASERERRAEARSIERMLTPGSVAVIGASTDPKKIGHVVFANLMAYGFAGPVYPVHPEARHIGGVRAYPTVLDVPDEVDLAVVAVPAPGVVDVVEQCGHKGVRGVVVMSGGFAERDTARPDESGGSRQSGREWERKLVAVAHAHGMRVIGPNCLGVVNADPSVRLNATIAPQAPGRGRVGFFCQSGALGVAILAAAKRWGLGLSTFVSAGNRADVSGNDLLQYWASDPETDVVLLYLESFGNPRKFARLARRVARTKPVVAVKTGRYAGATPALAARAVPVPEERLQALFEKSGVIRVETLTELFDVAQLLAYQPLPPGSRVATVTNSSALGVLVADACAAARLDSVATVDVGPDADVPTFMAGVRDAIDRADALVAVFAPALATPGDDFARALAEIAATSRVPVLTTFLGTEGVPAPLRRSGDDPTGEALRGSVPSYPTPERAVRALAAATRYAEWRRRPTGSPAQLDGLDTPSARALVEEVLATAPAGRQLTVEESGRLLAAYGIPAVERRIVTGAEDAAVAAERLGLPVAVKATAPALRHRQDLGAVRLDLGDATAVRAAVTALAELTELDAPVVVQRMAAPGVATVVEVLDDPTFGALVSFGVGGLATELLGDRAYAPVPMTDADAAELVAAPRAAPLLAGYRGSEPVDTGALQDLLLRVSRLAEELPEVLGLELNPVLVARSGLAVLSAAVTVGPPTSRVDPGPRRLPA